MSEKPPVELGQEVELAITGMGHDGAGVGKVEGFTVFVPMAVPGETIKARIETVKKTYARGKLMAIRTPHADRAEAPCPVYETCGGCQSQHLGYEAQLRHKRQTVIDHFHRLGGLEYVRIHPVLGMEEPWHYRNKAQVPFGVKNGRVVAGFYAPGSHEIVDMDQCLIQHPSNDRAVRAVKEWAQNFRIPIYDEKKHKGLLRHVVVRTGFQTGEVMVVLVTNGDSLPNKKALIDRLIQSVPGLKSVRQNINKRRTNVILGPQNRLLWGEETITDRIGPIRFAISPHSFYQVNPVQTRVLYDQVKKMAELTGQETVIDAYCGIGTISLYLARDAKKVYGVEIVPEAIRDAKTNARLNGITNAYFKTGAAEEVMPRWLEEGIRPDVVVLDPPRKGCDPVLLDAAAGMAPKRIIYVSCNSATLARDAKRLVEKGYHPIEVQPVDMFPQTGHVECVALFLP